MVAKNNVNLAIENYFELINSNDFKKFSKIYPVGTAWLEYTNDFKKYIAEKYRNKNINEFFNSLMSIGAINTPPSFSDSNVAKLAFEWHLESSNKYIPLIEKYPQVQESDLIKGNCVLSLDDGRNFSLDTFRYLGYINKINNKLCDVKNIEKYLELGSGNGGFARTLKLVNPKIKITLVDLPEVLFQSRIFLEYSFPESKHFYIRSLKDLKSDHLLDSDFVYVSNVFFKEWSNCSLEIDLFCNMRSIAEMPKHITDLYIDILKDVEIKNIFLENRYLNSYSKYHRLAYGFRKDEITGSTWMKNNWETINFDLEPSWAKSPYESKHPRYLALCMKSKNDNFKNKFLKKDENNLISSIKKQEWYMNFNDLRAASLASKPIILDNETLRILWEINRKNPTEESLKLIIDFISYSFDSENVEEIDYYKLLLKEKFNKKYIPITRFKLRNLLNSISKKVRTKISVYLNPSRRHFKNQ